VVDAECAYIRLLQHAGEVSAATVAELASSIVRDLEQWWPSALKSEYWTARFATFILPLGFRDTARRNLIDVGHRSIQVFWLLRFAHLLVTYGFHADAGDLLDAIDESPHKIWLDEFAHSKLVELHAQTGRIAAACAGLDALLGSPKLSTALTLTIAMTAVRIEDPDRLKRALMRLGMNGRGRSGDVFTVLSAAAVRSATMRAFAAAEADLVGDPADWGAAIVQAGLWLRLGAIQRANALLKAARGRVPDDYYALAGAGRRFMAAGAPDLAAECLERSKALRPKSHMHLDFVGRIYFDGRMWDRVRSTYEEAITLKPYVRSYLARHAYSIIAEPLKSSGALGHPSELTMIVQTDQDFYHDIGFRIK
jgi:tetratricopeptide (TPR) repeat protein